MMLSSKLAESLLDRLAAGVSGHAENVVVVLEFNGHGQLRTKADRIADIRSGASSIDSITHEEAPIVKTHGKTTLVLSRVTIVGTYSGHKVAHDFRSLHVWINEDGRWRLVFNQLTAVE